MNVPALPHIFVQTHLQSPRLDYILEVLLGRILGLNWSRHDTLPIETKGCCLHYGLKGKGLSIPASGLLSESHIRSDIPEINRLADLPVLFKVQETDNGLEFDVLAAAFYVVSEYETYQVEYLDHHQRYDQGRYRHDQLDLKRSPLLHRYAAYLWKGLQKAYPLLGDTPKPAYDYEITIDVDFPWKYANKSLPVQLGGLIKAAGSRGFKPRLRALLSGEDPNFTFVSLYDLCPPDKTRWFFLLERHSEHDSRFTWRHPAYQGLMRSIFEKGYGVGIHPSYATGRAPGFIGAETLALRDVLNQPIRHSRQHFLRYQHPGTFRALLDLGIKVDYTACLYQAGGFPNGMAAAFPWFDLLRNEATPLMRQPTITMDRTLQQYQKLSPNEAVEQVRVLRDTVAKWGGVFTLLLHNDSLSEYAEWIGWSGAIKEMVQLVREPRA